MHINKTKKKISFLIFLIILIFLGYLIWANFYSEKTKIEIDDNNTEVIINEKDIDEISKKLDQLDIDLEDILDELEL